MILGKTHIGDGRQIGICTTCRQWVNPQNHMCKEEMLGRVEQRSANLDDLLLELKFELKLVSALLTNTLQIAGSTEIKQGAS